MSYKCLGAHKSPALQGSSFTKLLLPETCPAWDARGKRFSLLMGPRARNQQTVRNVPLCQEKPARLKSPGVLFLEVNVITLCFLTGFACCYVPLQSLLKQEELRGGTLLEFDIFW